MNLDRFLSFLIYDIEHKVMRIGKGTRRMENICFISRKGIQENKIDCFAFSFDYDRVEKSGDFFFLDP